MEPTHGTHRLKLLYQEIEHHLMNDQAPSAYLNGIRKRQEFLVYPFDMLSRLQDTRQPPRHHPEGNVWNHTVLVVDEAAKARNKSRDARAFMWAALLHDIGKPSATKMSNGKITSYAHDVIGAELAGRFLEVFTEDCALIGKVTALIRYHMHILYIDKELPYADIKGMRDEADVAEVALLGLCDRLGRLGSDRQNEEAVIRHFLQKASVQ